ncbi:dynein regulatory complex protein 9 [Scomber japonicus]|uniref:dynein regulatory complex protein 9 n=1 Tax=Scomber japonicus TaxID=13676 RepID=UPI002305166D|nr:dynein regulatory complex protein 9 [Scomber japonicus]
MSLSRIQSLRLAAVLEDCSDQLDILGHALTVQISRERSSAPAQEEARMNKLKRDSEAKRELEFRQQNIQRQKEELEQKTETLKKIRHSTLPSPHDMQQINKELRHKLNEQPAKIAKKKKLEEKNNQLQLQKTQKEMGQAEKLLEDQLELRKKQLKEEMRVHEESTKFLQNQHEELQQLLQHWQERTKQMLQEKEQQLNNVRCKRTVILDKLMEMRRKYREMEQVVVEDREEQEKLRQQEAEARAATKMQAWWRGCMVRKGLGSYKKAEEEEQKSHHCKTGKPSTE